MAKKATKKKVFRVNPPARPLAAKKVVRTTAERRAAAKASWARRKAEAAAKSANLGCNAEPSNVGEVATQTMKMVASVLSPSTASATSEGDDLYVTISQDGSLFRHKLSYQTMRKLGLDCLHLVG
jgi:hypothetical protein